MCAILVLLFISQEFKFRLKTFFYNMAFTLTSYVLVIFQFLCL